MKKMLSLMILMVSFQASATDYLKKIEIYSGVASNCKQANTMLDEKFRKFVDDTGYDILAVEVLNCEANTRMRDNYTQKAILSVKLNGILGNR